MFRKSLIVLLLAFGVVVTPTTGSHLTCLKKNNENGIRASNCIELMTYRESIFNRKPKKHNRVACCDFTSNLNPNGAMLLRSFKCGYGTDYKKIYKKDYTAILEEYPWLALLRFNTPEKHFQCTGSLITDRFLLTSATCVKNKNLLSVRLGEHNIDTDPDCEVKYGVYHCAPPVEEFGIEKVFYHPEHMGIKNDIALIKLNETVNFKEHIKPICLPLEQRDIDIEPKKFVIAGWGTTEEGYTSSILQRAFLKYKTRKDCKTFFRHTDITDNYICVQGTDSTSYCHGDLGGPVFHSWGSNKLQRPRHTQYGIISIGLGRKNCRVETQPVLLTNVAQMMPWITTTILL